MRMTPFEEVCWHEAGHAIVASCLGVTLVRVLVRENGSQTDWVGFSHAVGGQADAKVIVSAGGLAGELIRKAPSFNAASANDLARARNRASEDRVTYDRYACLATGPVLDFEIYAATTCWEILNNNRAKHEALSNELQQTRVVGPLVLAEVLLGLPITSASRSADGAFLATLETLRPAPPPPYYDGTDYTF